MIRLNDLLTPDLTDSRAQGRFITFAAARLHPDGRLELFSAGHGPLLIRRQGGSVESHTSHALPLGLVDAAPNDPPSVLRLDPGDTLLLVSDGLLELRNPTGEEYGHPRLTHLLATAPAPPCADKLLEAIDAHNLSFAGSAPAADDRTLVVATCRGR